ncbi:methyl-accepting chemotaxis protein [Caballeronia sp. LZ019]|nr:methyl-accepting chemotaxis protein [Caballeronia sp. LZ016]MDR5806801.1 methyl-accepting chemotaxis protein [Caballeronia sp. LZ019]
MNLKTMSIKAKLALSFSFLTGVVLIVSAVSINALGDANRRFTGYVEGANARAAMAEQVRAAVDRRAIAARNMALVSTPADFALEKAAEARAQADVTANLGKLSAMIASATDTTDEARSLVAEINRVEALYAPVAQSIVELASEHRQDEAVRKINDECRPLLAALVGATDAYSRHTHRRAEALVADAHEHYAVQLQILAAICLGAVAAAVLAGVVITRGLTRALGTEPATLKEITQRVASGDLSPVGMTRAAPAGSVLSSMDAMQKSLVTLIGEVRMAADGIATGSMQIASGNADLSARTEEQASSLQETAASMEELTSTVRQNADNAQQASTLSANASHVAQQGNAVVTRVVETMTAISESSLRIADIIGIIEGIAFQTNILALNAAVEAARAGEQGRGFAVVASEVRSLAQRSSHAAKEIKELIGASVAKVEAGFVLAQDAGATMSDVLRAVARVSDIMDEIAAASGEQSRGIEQVNQAIAQMDRVTQQNAALVEQAAAASQALDDQGRHLSRTVSQFRIEHARA